ncbi:hypothetical protein B0H13DRAFT_1914472 [Mycena leptocephala]|nr:hypothetical protein B0H13DRAFT_1914472 [Mycena leptocephala]
MTTLSASFLRSTQCSWAHCLTSVPSFCNRDSTIMTVLYVYLALNPALLGAVFNTLPKVLVPGPQQRFNNYDRTLRVHYPALDPRLLGALSNTCPKLLSQGLNKDLTTMTALQVYLTL